MAKRTRGSARPGQRHADRRGPSRPQPRPETRPASALSEDEEARASELEAKIVAQARDAEAVRARPRVRGADVERTPRSARGPGLLATKAAEEYAYVVRDVRRILQVGGAMVAILAVLYVLVDLAHVITIG